MLEPEHSQEFDNLAEQALVDFRKLEVPFHLLCVISDELMTEPVILSSGFTYEKEVIL